MMLPGRDVPRLALRCLAASLALGLAGCRVGLTLDVVRAAAQALPSATAAHAEPPSPTAASTARPTALPPDPPTATATPPRLVRLTDPGCCVQPGWSPDSRDVVFISRPAEKQSAGIYAVARDGGPARLIYRRPQLLSADWGLSAWPEGEFTRLWRRADGRSWLVDTSGAMPRFSPDGSRLAWAVASRPYTQIDIRQTAIWAAQVDGSQRRKVTTLQGGSLIGWASKGDALYVSGRMPGGGRPGVWRVPLDETQSALLFDAARVHDPLLSPDGRWLAFYVAFAAEPGANGLWILDTGSGSAQRVTPFGAYRWRDENRLLLFPLEGSLPAAELWQVDVQTGEIHQLTDSRVTPLTIANNDWQPSPDGRWLAFVSGEDHAIWALELPPAEGSAP